MNKFDKIENLLYMILKYIDNAEERIIYIYDIIDYIKNNLVKNDLIELIYILLNTLEYNTDDLKAGSVADGFSFWLDDLYNFKKSSFISHLKDEVKK